MKMKFPGGHVEYSFQMFIDHRMPITLQSDDSRIKEITISKILPDDPFDNKWKLTIICSEVSSIQEVDCIGEEKREYLFNLISFIFNIRINNIRLTGHGVIPRKGEGGQGHMIMPSPTVNGVFKNAGRKIKESEIQELGKLLISRRFANHPLVNIYSYALKIEEPVVQFMLLYLILYEICKDQKSLDEYIMKKFPNTLQSLSPYNKKLETIYTKLRNEITHRVDSSPQETRNGIVGNIDNLKCIVHTTIMAKI